MYLTLQSTSNFVSRGLWKVKAITYWYLFQLILQSYNVNYIISLITSVLILLINTVPILVMGKARQIYFAY